jgi:integrase
MSAKNSHIPKYRRHRQSGQAIVTLPDSTTGRRKDVLLGKYGTKASKDEWQRVVVEWEANNRRLPEAAHVSDLTITELADRYWQHVESYYRHADGTPTGEVQAMRYALRPLTHLRGPSPASDFGPAALKSVRDVMVRGYEHPKYGKQTPACRTQVNARVKRIRRMFRWAVENELVPPSVVHGLSAVAPLKYGRTEAHESKGVGPVARAVVDATLRLLPPMLADMVRLQLETGMRPGELVVMRVADIDMTGAVWIFKPDQHKTRHHGHERVVAIGPKGQEIVKRWLTLEFTAYLFAPHRGEEERYALKRASRKSPLWPSHVKHQAEKRKRRCRPKRHQHYTVGSYGRGVARAIDRHNEDKPEGEHLPHWTPHQLRHLRALELKRDVGLDVARAVLGHRSPTITEHYATLDTAAAATAMARLG